MILVGTSKRMLASEPRELGDRRRKRQEAMERAQDGMSVPGHHRGETTMATTKTTTVLVGGREMDTITASHMEALSTDDDDDGYEYGQPYGGPSLRMIRWKRGRKNVQAGCCKRDQEGES